MLLLAQRRRVGHCARDRTLARNCDFTPVMWASLAYGVLINYGFAQLIWFGLARDLPPSTSAMSVMAIPMIGTLSAT